MAVTLKTIAAEAGVDVSVVSRVLNNKSEKFRISSKRRDQILSISKDLGYIPNSHAQSISNGKFNCLSLVTSTYKDRSYLPSVLIDAVGKALEEKNKHLLLAKIPDKTTAELSTMPLFFRSIASDGILINYTHHMPRELVRSIEDIGLPSVWINAKLQYDSVYANSIKAAQQATERLIRSGHRKIAYIDIHNPVDTREAHFSTFDRHEGYKMAMLHAGLEPIRYSPKASLNPNDEGAVKFFYDILRSPNRPSALLTYWSHAMSPLHRALYLTELSVPDDLSVITFASQSSVELGLTVSAMVGPEYEMGAEAVKLYLKKEEQGGRLPSKSLDFSFKDMGTCVKPKTG